ncbi:MAG: tetratricopeptide repeat protein [Candidatus Hodarchaeales archaeon]
MTDEYNRLKREIREAKIQGMLGNQDKALKIYDRIINDYRDKCLSNNDTNKQYHHYKSFVVEALYLKSHVFISKLEFDMAKQHTSELEQFAKRADYPAGLARAYHALAYISSYADNYNKGLVQAQKSLEISQKQVKALGNQKFSLILLSTSYHVLALINYFKGDLNSSIDFNLQSIAISEKIINDLALANSYNNLANCYSEKGDHEKAIEFYEKSRRRDEELNNLRGMAIALSNMAIEYSYTSEYEKALAHNQESMDLFREAGLENVTTENLNTFGRLYHDMGEYQPAADYFEQALAQADKSQILKEKAQILGDYAKLLFSRGSFKQAERMFRQSLATYEETGLEEELVGKLCSYAELLLTINKLEEADEILTKATEIATKHGSKREMLECLFIEILVEKRQENYGIAKDSLQDLLKQAKDMKFYRMQVNACLVLAEFAVERFQKVQTKKSFEKAMKYIEKVEKLTRTAKMFPKLIQTVIIKASLYTANLEFEKAFVSLVEAKRICAEKKLKKFTGRVETMMDQVSDRRTIVDQVPSNSIYQLRRMATEDVLRMIDFRFQKDLEIINEFNVGATTSFYLTVFKYGKSGPMVIATDELPFKKTEQVLLSIGMFYSMAVGQGNRHHEGLFGPLPLADYSDFVSLIYTATIRDSSQKDGRMKGMSYCLFCVFYPTKFTQLFYDRNAIASVFESELRRLDDVQDLSVGFLADLKSNIFNSVIQA